MLTETADPPLHSKWQPEIVVDDRGCAIAFASSAIALARASAAAYLADAVSFVTVFVTTSSLSPDGLFFMFSSSLCSTDSPHARGRKAGSPQPPWMSGTSRHRSPPPHRSPLGALQRPAQLSKHTDGTRACAWSACRLPSRLPRTLRSPRKGTSIYPQWHLQQCSCQRFNHGFVCPEAFDCRELSQLSMQTLRNCRELSPQFRDSVGSDGGTIAALLSGMTILAVVSCPCGAPASVQYDEYRGIESRWRVCCATRLVKRRPTCVASENEYARTREMAVNRWNSQFLRRADDDGTPKCPRCGLRLPCSNCLGRVEDYARSGLTVGGQ